MELLPDHATLVRERMVSDPRFRAICDDYCTAVAALRHWEALRDPPSAERQAEYRELVRGLEDEIRDALGLARSGIGQPPAM